MNFDVYFQYGVTEQESDFLKSFKTWKEANQYCLEQIEKEAWSKEDEKYEDYVKQYKIKENK